METFLIRAVQLILSLSILVVLHELGHFLFARLFKVRVEKFYIFFNPNFSLIRAKKINGKWQVKYFSKNLPANERPKTDEKGEVIVDKKGRPVMEQIPVSELPEGDWRKYPETTEWGIGWLPLGGYCSISGMIDETKDVTQLATEPQPWEYRSRPVYQRMGIISGGVLVNFILAMIIFSAVLFTWGKEYLPLKNAKYGLQFAPVLIEGGFRNGDNIVSIDGQAVEDYSKAIEQILIEGKQNISVLRDGAIIDIQLPKDITKKLLSADEKNYISLRAPFVIDEVSEGSPAAKANLQPGDSLVGINSRTTAIFQEIAEELDLCKNTQVELIYYRNNQRMKAITQLNEDGKLGVTVRPLTDYVETNKTEYGFFESIPAGIQMGWEKLTSYVKQFKLVFTREGAKQMGGFGAIGQLFPKTWDWQIFWSMTGWLSIILAFMNFLPIPALDGGYFLYLIYEIITGKKPSDKFLEYAQTTGFFLLMALLIYANGNDLFRAFFK